MNSSNINPFGFGDEKAFGGFIDALNEYDSYKEEPIVVPGPRNEIRGVDLRAKNITNLPINNISQVSQKPEKNEDTRLEDAFSISVCFDNLPNSEKGQVLLDKLGRNFDFPNKIEQGQNKEQGEHEQKPAKPNQNDNKQNEEQVKQEQKPAQPNLNAIEQKEKPVQQKPAQPNLNAIEQERKPDAPPQEALHQFNQVDSNPGQSSSRSYCQTACDIVVYVSAILGAAAYYFASQE